MEQKADGLAIDLRDVAKVYKGRVHALQGIEMKVRRGEVFGLLGPNGAGKSTLVKIMMTVIRPTRADGTLLGQPVGHKPTLRHVGYLPENHRFPKYLTGRQTLEFFGALAKVDRRTRKRRSAELLETVGMKDWGDRKISTYSKGMLQRVGLGQALVMDPDLVVLDEPTDGVDPVGRRDIREVLQRLRDRGKTVFINSHLLSELEMMCDRVAILVQGKVSRQGTIEELTYKSQRYEIEIEMPTGGNYGTVGQAIQSAIGGAFTNVQPVLPMTTPSLAPPVGMPRPQAARGPLPAPPVPPPRPPAMRGTLEGGQWVEVDGTTVRVGTSDPAPVQKVLDALRAGGLVIRRLLPVRQTLEDLFMEAVTDPTTGIAAAPGARRGGRQ